MGESDRYDKRMFVIQPIFFYDGLMLDTDQLRSFLAIVDTGSFTRAAERVHKTQSAVSMHIKRLEERLGGKALFAKNGRGVRLTEDGEKLIDYARRMLQVEAAALAAVGEKGLAGHLRFGIPDDYAESFLPEILRRFVRRHPLVELSVVCEPSVSLAERVQARELDIAVVTDCARIVGVEVVREEALRWVVGPRASVQAERPLPLALGGPTCAWRQAALAALDAAGMPWRLALVSANYAAIAPIVEAGLAVTVLPPSAMRTGQRFVDPDGGLPALPHCRIGLIESPAERSREALALAEDIRSALAMGRRPDDAFASTPIARGAENRKAARSEPRPAA